MDLCLWDKCNNRCLMCTNPEAPWPAWDGSFDYGYEAIIGRLEKIKEEIKKDDSIYLSGGEPTLHPRFFDLMNYLKVNFPEQTIKLLSNARRCSYPDFARRLIESANNLEVDASIYGPTAAIHDQVTRADGSFEQTRQGLKNLLKYKKGGQVIGLRLVLTKLSYKFIVEYLNLILKEFSGMDRLIIIFPEIEGQARQNLDLIRITYQEARRQLGAIKEQLKKFKEIRLYHFPLCALDQALWPNAWRTLPVDEVMFAAPCHRCAAKKYCLGIPKTYADNMGVIFFKAVKKLPAMEFSKNCHQPIVKLIK
jgi:MoaA/NifB/PqqE/SkfB family radical SAM enzyme